MMNRKRWAALNAKTERILNDLYEEIDADIYYKTMNDKSSLCIPKHRYSEDFQYGLWNISYIKNIERAFEVSIIVKNSIMCKTIAGNEKMEDFIEDGEYMNDKITVYRYNVGVLEHEICHHIINVMGIRYNHNLNRHDLLEEIIVESASYVLNNMAGNSSMQRNITVDFLRNYIQEYDKKIDLDKLIPKVQKILRLYLSRGMIPPKFIPVNNPKYFTTGVECKTKNRKFQTYEINSCIYVINDGKCVKCDEDCGDRDRYLNIPDTCLIYEGCVGHKSCV